MVDEDVTEHESDATVRGFVVLPKKQVVWLSELRRDEAPEQQFRLGAAPYSDIRIGSNPEVADTHCLLVWSLERLEVRDRAPGKLTLFNGMAVNGFAYMCAGDVLTIGSKKQLLRKPEQLTHIMAFRHSPNEKPKIPVRDFPELVLKTKDYHGDKDQRAARAIKIPRTTYVRKLAKLSAMALVVFGFAAGGLLLSSRWTPDRPQASAAREDVRPVPIAPASSQVRISSDSQEASAKDVSSKQHKRVQTVQESPKKPRPRRVQKKRDKPKEEPVLESAVDDRQPQGRGIYHEAPTGARGVFAEELEEDVRESNI